MGRVTRQKVYSSKPNESVRKLVTPRKSKRKRNALKASPTTPSAKQKPLEQITSKQLTPRKFCAKPASPYVEDGYAASQVPCEIGWDTHNEFIGTNLSIADILNNLKEDSKEICDLEVIPSTPSLVGILHAPSPPQNDQTLSAVQVGRRTSRSKSLQPRRLKAAMKCSDLLKKLQTAMLESQKEECEEGEASAKTTPRRITRSHRCDTDEKIYPSPNAEGHLFNKPAEESSDMFETKPSPVRSSLRVKQLFTSSSKASPKQNGSMIEDLWSDDDFGDESFVRVTQTIAEEIDFVSPKCPPSKRRFCQKSESLAACDKKITFKLDINTKNTGCVMSKESSLCSLPLQTSAQVTTSALSLPAFTASKFSTDKVTNTGASSGGISAPVVKSIHAAHSHSNYTEQAAFCVENDVHVTVNSANMPLSRHEMDKAIKPDLLEHSPVISAQIPGNKTERVPIKRNHFMPLGTPASSTVSKPTLCLSQVTVPGSTKSNGKEHHSCIPHVRNSALNYNCVMNEKQASAPPELERFKCQSSSVQFGKPEKPVDKIFVQNNQMVPGFRQPNSLVTKPAASHRAKETKIHAAVTSQGVISTHTGLVNTSLHWSHSQISATSTQLASCDGEKQRTVEMSAKVQSFMPVSNNNRMDGAKSSLKVPERSTNKMPHASHVWKESSTTTKHSKRKTCNTTECALDGSISDDILVTLAEPDEFLDSQACLELLESPEQHVPVLQSAKNVKEPKVEPTDSHGNEKDYLDFIFDDRFQNCTPDVKRSNVAGPTECDDFDADDLGPDILTMLDEVELTVSQEKEKITNSKATIEQTARRTTFTDRQKMASIKTTCKPPPKVPPVSEGFVNSHLENQRGQQKPCDITSDPVKTSHQTGNGGVVPRKPTCSPPNIKDTAISITGSTTSYPSKCAPDEIEKKRLEALKRRQNKLRLTKNCLTLPKR